MRTYLLIGCIMAAIACIIALCAIIYVKSEGKHYTMHGYNVLISGILLAWFFWPVYIAWILYLLILKFTNTDRLHEIEYEMEEETTEEES